MQAEREEQRPLPDEYTSPAERASVHTRLTDLAHKANIGLTAVGVIEILMIIFNIIPSIATKLSIETTAFAPGSSVICVINAVLLIATVAVAYIPVAFVVFAEHIADHKNLSSIIEEDLLENPGLHCTLLGDGVGSAVGAFFGGCPNTTYGESVGCVAISGNASVVTIVTTAIMAIVISFFAPFAAFLSTIPNCVMGGVCIALYGFIAVSGLKMIQKVDLNDNRNLFVVAAILIPGIGGLSLTFGKVTITTIACALILGILANTMLSRKKKDAE
mgnify:CR=1 FL=1